MGMIIRSSVTCVRSRKRVGFQPTDEAAKTGILLPESALELREPLPGLPQPLPETLTLAVGRGRGIKPIAACGSWPGTYGGRSMTQERRWEKEDKFVEVELGLGENSVPTYCVSTNAFPEGGMAVKWRNSVVLADSDALSELVRSVDRWAAQNGFSRR